MGGFRRRRLALGAGYHTLVALVTLAFLFAGTELASQPLFDAGVLLLIFHLLTFQRLPLIRWSQQRLLQKHRCSQCGLQVDLVASWRCVCKYVSPERHALSPCPSCGKGFAWVACPSCGTGVLI